jgi:hypothetical protein
MQAKSLLSRTGINKQLVSNLPPKIYVVTTPFFVAPFLIFSLFCLRVENKTMFYDGGN